MSAVSYRDWCTTRIRAGARARSDRARAARRLFVHAGALAVGATARLGPDAATWFGVRGPHCPIGVCLGPIACPGCGLVRSVVAMLHGDLLAAWQLHPAGPVVALLAAAGVMLETDIVRRGAEAPRHCSLRRSGRLILVVAILTGWLLRFFVLP